MRFGLMQLVSGVGGRTPAEVYGDNLELVVLADELGFDCAWVAEHHFSDYGLVPNTLQYLAAAASRTTRIRLGAAVVVTTLHNPIRVAEEIGFLDQLSGGRIEVGVGRGYQPREFEAFGRSMEDSRAIFDDSIAFLRRAWSADGPFDWDGPSAQGRGIEIVPQPVQRPHPPLWLACVSQGTFEKAGQGGWQIMTSPNFTPVKVVRDNFEVYTKALADAGHTPSAFEFPIMQMVYAGADEQSAYDEPQEPCMGYFQKLSSLLPTEVRAGGGDSYEQFRKTQRKLTDLRYDYLFENSSVLFGSPGRLIDRIRHLQEEIGLTYLVGLFNFGTLDQEKARASMRRFATEVMPAFRS
jgi:natural product biosynthesis luciferase-like monooxygenase protein